MFRKLKLKLTLINAGVMAILLILVLLGTYVLMRVETYWQTEQTLQIIASGAGAASPGKPLLDKKNEVRYFYAKTNESGSLLETSPALPFSQSQLTFFIERMLKKGDSKGDIEWRGESYEYLVTPLKEGSGFLFIFVGTEDDKELLGILLAALSVAGLISLALALYASRFLAEKAMGPIKKSWQRQREFVADASHELRTPLAVVQTNLELVMGNPQETIESQTKWLENIQAENKRMAKLVNDLLFLARADSRQQVLDTKTFSLDTALRAASEPFTPLAEAKGLTLESAIEAGVMFNGDEGKIKQLVLILLDNALKHTPQGGWIKLCMKKRNTLVELSVADTGEGIEPNQMERIFERFYRVDKARTKEDGGTGLGLTIAEWIVKSHGGTIKVSSIVGKGSEFVVSLPCPNKGYSTY